MARPVRMTLAPARRQRYPARPMGEARRWGDTGILGKPRRRRGSRSDRFRVRDRGRLEVTGAVEPNVAGELAGSGTASDRCCPLRSGRSWPGCGPDVAPAVPSLEGASRQPAQPRSYADGAGQVGTRPTAVDREGPPDAGATGTRRARPARTRRAPAWRQWSQAQPEGEAS